MKNMIKLTALLLSVVLLMGCSPEQGLTGVVKQPAEAETPISEDVLQTFGISYFEGEKINPITSNTKINRLLVEALYEGLFEINNDFKPQPVLCESFQRDGLTYTFQIKDGIRFWSGEKLTASDVAYAYQAAKKNEQSPYFGRFQDVKSISVKGERELVIVLTAPNADFPALLDVPVFRKGSEEQMFSDGTGAFHPCADEGKYWLEPYQSWQGGKVTAPARIELVSTVRADAISYSFETGELSLTRTDCMPADAMSITGAVEIVEAPTADLYFLGINHKKTLYSLAKVRQALSLFIDRGSLCSVSLQGAADPAVIPMQPQVEQYSMAKDAEKARSLLAQSGISDTNADDKLDWSPLALFGLDSNMTQAAKTEAVKLFGRDTQGKRTSFSVDILVCNENSAKVEAAEKIAQDFMAGGIEAMVRALAYEDYIKALEDGDFDLYLGEVLLSPDFDLRALILQRGALNYGQAGTAHLDEVIINARAGGNKETLWQAFIEEQPILPLGFKKDQLIVRAGMLKEIEPTPYQTFANVENWEAAES